MRDLTRHRKRLIQTHTSEGQRVEKTLEDGIKLDVVASDILGVSGRAMLDALVAGGRDPEVLAELAKGVCERRSRGCARCYVAGSGNTTPDRRAGHGPCPPHRGRDRPLDARIDEVIAPFAAARDSTPSPESASGPPR
ncbi:MAG: hypothetical protein ACYDEN_11650 [Acidimicrobiales bacterium]